MVSWWFNNNENPNAKITASRLKIVVACSRAQRQDTREGARSARTARKLLLSCRWVPVRVLTYRGLRGDRWGEKENRLSNNLQLSTFTLFYNSLCDIIFDHFDVRFQFAPSSCSQRITSHLLHFICVSKKCQLDNMQLRKPRTSSCKSAVWGSRSPRMLVFLVGVLIFISFQQVADIAIYFNDSPIDNPSGIVSSISKGESGGDWTWCTHVVKYGLNFDYGLASFLADQLKPSSALEFGSGVGIYVEYLARHGGVSGPVYGAEPTDMSLAGVFGRTTWPKQITGNLLDESRAKYRESLGTFDLVYSIEVAEHVDPSLHPELVKFLSRKTSKYLVFSAARPGQPGTGHLPASMLPKEKWIALFEQEGLHHLPQLSNMLLENCDDRNVNHKTNPFVMGVSPTLDTNVKAPGLRRSNDKGEKAALESKFFPHVKSAIAANKDKCES